MPRTHGDALVYSGGGAGAAPSRRPIALHGPCAVAALAALLAASTATHGYADTPDAPSPLKRWIAAYGLVSAAEAQAFAEAGFNCAVIELPYAFGDREGEWASLDALLDACDQRRIAVMLGVRGIVPPSQDGPTVMNPYDRGYMASLGTRVFKVVQAAGTHECVVAWMTPRRASEFVGARPTDFADYLASRYGSLEELERAWGRGFASFADATFGVAASLSGATDSGFGLPALDVAAFQTLAHRDLLAAVAGAYRRHDRAGRPIVVGEECAYWALANVPPGLAAAITGIYPDEAEPDVVTQNAHAVDVARAGGLRKAFFGIRVTAYTTPDELARYAAQGFVRGAWGIVVSDWHTVAGEPLLRSALARVAEAADELGTYEPTPPAALLYQPIHAGAAARDGRFLYGRLDAPGWPCEPMDAMLLYGRGTRYGGLDVVPAHEATAPALARYSTVIAPQLYDTDEPLMGALWDYVRSGGVLYCDLGVGMRQTGSIRQLPEPLVPLLGVFAVPYVWPMALDGQVAEVSPVLPSLRQDARTTGAPFRGVVGDARITTGARPTIVIRSRRDDRLRMTYAGLFAHPVGSGATIYATVQCVGTWTPLDPLGRAFWGDLLGRGRAIENVTAPGLLTPGLDVRHGGGTLVAASSADTDGIATVDLYGAPGQLISRGVLLVGAGLSPTRVTAHLGARELWVGHLMPVWVSSGRALARVERYDSRGLEVTLAAPDARVAEGPRGSLELVPATPQPFELVVRTGRLQVLPNEEFRLTVTSADGSVARTAVVADETGAIRVAVADTPLANVLLEPRALAGDDQR